MPVDMTNEEKAFLQKVGTASQNRRGKGQESYKIPTDQEEEAMTRAARASQERRAKQGGQGESSGGSGKKPAA